MVDVRPPEGRTGTSRSRRAVGLVRGLHGSARVRSTVAAGMGTMVGSALGAVLPFVLVRWFGAGEETDVYFLLAGAAQLAGYLLSAVVEGVLAPTTVAALARGREELRAFAFATARHVLLLLAVPVTVLMVVLVALALLPTAGLTETQHSQGLLLLVALLPYPALVALSSVFGASHYAHGRFASTTASQALRAVGALVGAVFAGGGLGLAAVAVGLSVGEAVRVVLLAATLPRDRTRRGPAASSGASARAILGASTPVLLSTVIVAVNPLVDKTVASRLGVGAVTLIELAEKLYYIPMVLLVSATLSVSGVAWARLVDDPAALARDFWRVQRVALAASVALAVLGVLAVLAARQPATRLLGLDPGTPFATVFVFYIVGLPFAFAQALAGRLLVVMGRTSMLPVLAVLLVALNLVADIVGAALLGVEGLALSSTLVRLVNALVFLVAAGLVLSGRTPRVRRGRR